MTASTIWQMVVDNLATQMTPVAMNAWIKPCEPLDLTGDRMTVRVKNGLQKEVINSRFSAAIVRALCDIFSAEGFELLVLTEEDQYTPASTGDSDDRLPEIPN